MTEGKPVLMLERIMDRIGLAGFRATLYLPGKHVGEPVKGGAKSGAHWRRYAKEHGYTVRFPPVTSR